MLPWLDQPTSALSVSGHGLAAPAINAGDVFVCADCEAAAQQFTEIQDSMWVEAGEDGESTDEIDNPARP